MATPEQKRKEEEERKKGAAPFTLARGAKGTAELARGGLGLGSGAAGRGGLAAYFALSSKAGMVMLLTAMGIGAWGVGQYIRPMDTSKDPRIKVGASHEVPKYDVDPKTLPTDGRYGSSMQVVPSSIDGLTDAERAAKKAAEEAAAKAEADKQAKADAAAKAPDASAKPADPADAAAAAAKAAAGEGAEGAKKNSFGTKFGALSGVGGSGKSLNGGGGMFSPSQNFGQKLGEAKGFGSTKSPGRSAATAARSTNRGRGALKQLEKAAMMSRQGAATGVNEASSQAADQAFNNNPGANSTIGGAGAGSQPQSGTGAGSSPAVNPNPTSGTETPASDTGTTAAPYAPGANVSPWKMLSLAGGAALLIAGVLLALSAMKAKEAKTLLAAAVADPTQASKAAYLAAMAMAKMFAMAALAMGVIATLCGIAIMGMGQKMYGMIMTGGGALISVLAYMAMSGADDAQGQLDKAIASKTDATGATVAGNSPSSAPASTTGGNVAPNAATGSAAGPTPAQVQAAGLQPASPEGLAPNGTQYYLPEGETSWTKAVDIKGNPIPLGR